MLRFLFPALLQLCSAQGLCADRYGDRGFAPLDSSGSFEVSGITVDTVVGRGRAAGRLAAGAACGQWMPKMTAAARQTVRSSSARRDRCGSSSTRNRRPNRCASLLGIIRSTGAGQILGVSGQISRVRAAARYSRPVVGGTAELHQAPNGRMPGRDFSHRFGSTIGVRPEAAHEKRTRHRQLSFVTV
jgi:hypothetical protein